MSSRIPSLAVRNVARNRRRSAITLLAILLGITGVVLLRGMVNGFLGLMVQDVVEGKTGALQIHRKGYVGNLEGLPNHLNMPQSTELLERVRSVQGVKAVTERIQFSGLISNGMTQTMFVGRAINPSTEAQVCPNSSAKDQQFGPEERAHALVGTELAKSLRAVTPRQKQQALASGAPEAASLVDFVTLAASSPQGRSNSVDVSLKGQFSSDFPFENKRVVTVPLSLAQELLGLEGRVTEYAVAVEDIDELDRVMANLQSTLGPEYEVHSWKELMPMYRDVIERQRFVLGVVSFILFVIVLAGIMNTMLMSVYERVREIGTLLAIGVRRKQIMLLFLLEAGVLGVLGGLSGALLGWVLVGALSAAGVPMKMATSQYPVQLHPTVELPFLGVMVVTAMLGAVLSAAYPAWKASRMEPVEALRSL